MKTNTLRISICFNFIFMVFVIGLMSSHAIAQTDSQEKITISVDSAAFTTLTSSFDHQAKAIVAYQTVDPLYVGAKINAIMEILTPDGTLIKTSSFPNGFEITESGRLQLASTIDDPRIETVIINIVLTDLEKTDVISNAVGTTVSLDGDVRYGNDGDGLSESSSGVNWEQLCNQYGGILNLKSPCNEYANGSQLTQKGQVALACVFAGSVGILSTLNPQDALEIKAAGDEFCP